MVATDLPAGCHVAKCPQCSGIDVWWSGPKARGSSLNYLRCMTPGCGFTWKTTEIRVSRVLIITPGN